MTEATSTAFTLDAIKQLWIEQNYRMAAQINSISAGNYIGACGNWAIQMGTQGRATMPKPVAPRAIKALMVFEPDWSCTFPDTDSLVSDVTPESFLPKFPTDTNAIGGPVGGPILNDPGKFYMASDDDRKLWFYTSKDGRKFTRVHETPFKMYWLELK